MTTHGILEDPGSSLYSRGFSCYHSASFPIIRNLSPLSSHSFKPELINWSAISIVFCIVLESVPSYPSVIQV